MNDQLWWAYIAGFFDGEGCIFVSSLTPHVIVSQSGERGRQVMDDIEGFLASKGVSHIHRVHKVYKGNKAHYLPKFEIRIFRRLPVEITLRGMLPYLRVKKLEAQDALRRLKLFPTLHSGQRTHCDRGHRLAGDNLHVGARGQRVCRICSRRRDRTHYHREHPDAKYAEGTIQ